MSKKRTKKNFVNDEAVQIHLIDEDLAMSNQVYLDVYIDECTDELTQQLVKTSHLGDEKIISLDDLITPDMLRQAADKLEKFMKDNDVEI